MKKSKCKKCGHEINLVIKDKDRKFTYCGQLMVKATETVSCRNAGYEAASP
jgi:DNA-directed RNA polymerase subunit RPC12/RpoP